MFYDINGNTVTVLYDIDGNRLSGSFEGQPKQYILHGASSQRPPNSMLLFEWGLENGYRFVEADVFVTADGVPVLCHDNEINFRARNDDGTAIAESVKITESTYAELMQYDFGWTVTPKYPGTRICRLDDLLDFCNENGMCIMLDIKSATTTDGYDIIYNLVASRGMVGKTVWCVANNKYLTSIDPNLTIEVEGVIATATPWKDKTAAVIIGSSSYATVFTKEFIDEAHANGFFVDAWTIDNQATADGLFANGCDFIITNKLLNSSIQ